jgi:hypothetical protein
MAEAMARGASGTRASWIAYPAPVLLVPLTWLCYIRYDWGSGVAFDLRPLLFPMVIWFGASFGRMGLICYLVGAFPFGFVRYSIEQFTFGGAVDEYLASIALIVAFAGDGTIDERVASAFSRLQETILGLPVRSFLILGFMLSLTVGSLQVYLDLYNLLLVLMILLGCRASAADDNARLIKAVFAASVPISIVWALRWFYLNGAVYGEGWSISIDHVLSQWPCDFANFVMALVIGRLIGNVFRSEQSRLTESGGTTLILSVLALLFATLRLSVGLTFGFTPSLYMSVAMPILYAFAFLLGGRYGMRGLVAVAIATVVVFVGTGIFMTHLSASDGGDNTTLVIYHRALDEFEYFANLSVRDPGFIGTIAMPIFALIGTIAIRRYRMRPEPLNRFGARFNSQ